MTQAKLQTRSLQRVYGRGLLLSILEKDSILIKVRVFNDGRFTAETVDWNVYWQSHSIQPGDVIFDQDLVLCRGNSSVIAIFLCWTPRMLISDHRT